MDDLNTQPVPEVVVPTVELGKNKRKLIILVFVLFSIFVAVSTILSERQQNAPSVTVTPTPIDESSPSGEVVESSTPIFKEPVNKYENTTMGISFNYPQTVGLINEDGVGASSASTIYLSIDNLNNPLTKNLGTYKQDQQLLESGSFGLEILPVKHQQKGIFKSGQTNVKLFTTLEADECFGAVLNRHAVFYRFDRRVSLTLSGPHSLLIQKSPNFFTKGSGDCNNETVWSSIGQETFLFSISNRTAPDFVLKWQDDFGNIVSSLKITNPTDSALFTGSVRGRWQGENMVVSLIVNNKLGLVTEMKLWYSDNEEGDWEAFTAFKTVPSKDKIRVKFKDQYGNVSNVYSTSVEFK